VEPSSGPLAIRLFGAFELRAGEQALPPPRSRREQWLLALLIFQQGRDCPRSGLAALLWPESGADQASYNLRRTLTQLRRALGTHAGRLRAPTRETVAFDLAGVEVDVLSFDRAVAEASPGSLGRAVALYRGPLLKECSEEWVLFERESRELAYLSALEALAAAALAEGRPAEAEASLRRALAAQPLRESAHRGLMQALAAQGNHATVALVYRDLCRRLRGEGVAEPDAETTALFEHLQASARRPPGSLSVAREASLPPSSPVASPGVRVPRPISRLIGREDETAAIAARLAFTRLVTLTGTGGVGKTRLAIQVAETVSGRFPDGVCFADLAPLADPALVPQTAARAVGLLERSDVPAIEALTAFLRPRRLLLLLDNCEHVVEESARLAASLLPACPELTILATSRQPLRITGEITWRVASLGQDDSVRLFLDRAAAVMPTLHRPDEEDAAIAGVCRRLDGLPLAIELAAARLKMMTGPQLLARIEDRFRLLTGGSSTAPPRQQTLQATLDWSHDLLSEPERALLRRLSVFAGGFTLEAAEAVGERSYAGETFNLLDALVDRSLVLLEEGERYRLLETVRQYARERLRESGEAEVVRERHLTFYLGLSEENAAHLRGARQLAALARLEAEHDNLRAALETSLAVAPERALRLAAALAPFWEVRGYLEEGRRRLSSVLEKAGPWRASRHAAAALEGAGALAFLQGDFDAAHAFCEAALQRWRRLGDQAGVARSLGRLGRLIYDQGDYPMARTRIEEGLAIARTLEDPAGLATALAHLADLTYHQGEFSRARALYEESLGVSRDLEDAAGIARALLGLGHVARRQGNDGDSRGFCEECLVVRRAMGDLRGVAEVLLALGAVVMRQGDALATRAHAEEALSIGRRTGDRPIVAGAMGLLGDLAWRQGDHAEARRFHEEALALWRALECGSAVIHSLGALGHLARDEREWGRAHALYGESLRLRREAQDLNAVIASLEDFAELAAAEGEWARMTRLLAATSTQRRATQRPLLPPDQAEHDRRLQWSRAALGEAVFARAFEEGARMTLEEAIAVALAREDPPLVPDLAPFTPVRQPLHPEGERPGVWTDRLD
jgi:predicted ATPase/DNA-binding SARP family transcriptional activator